MTHSQAIDEAVEKAIFDGNVVLEISTGWTAVKEVVHMVRPLSQVLRGTLLRDVRLRAFSAPASPHNKAEEGFKDDVAKVAITFPMP